jgi:hypothetical protein
VSAPKHTPGPWVAAANKVYGPFQVRVAHCGRDSGLQTTPQEDDANARLIAAAPDLLEVALLDQEVSNLLDELASCKDGMLRVGIENRLDVVRDQKAVVRRAAIAKAEGRG